MSNILFILSISLINLNLLLLMSNWATKSDQSFKASNKLIVDSFFNASVHASYYSCVQFMLHINSIHFGLTDNQIDEMHNESKTSTHQHLRKTIFESLRTIDPDFAVDFNDEMARLCSRRNTADYKSKMIDENEANNLRQLAFKNLSHLKAIYK